MCGRFDMDTTYSEFAREVARTELRETPEVVGPALAELRQLLAAEPNLYFGDTDEELLVYLKPCKHYAASALTLMKNIAKFKKDYADLFANVKPEDEKEMMTTTNLVNVLVNCDQKGRRVIIMNLGDQWNPKEVTLDQGLRLIYMVHLIAVLEPNTTSNGIIVLLNFSGLGMRQVSSFTPRFAKVLFTFIQEALPFRVKEIHVINQPLIFKGLWTMMKPFVNEKLNKRISFHGSDYKKLHEKVSPDTLPADFGGTLPALDYTSKEWYPALEKYKAQVDRMGAHGYRK